MPSVAPNSSMPCYDISKAPYSGNIQAAINDAVGHGGGTVYVPTGAWPITATLVIPSNSALPLPAGVNLVGDGMHSSLIYSNLQIDLLQIKASYVNLQDIGFQGAQAPGVGRGIVIGDASFEMGRVVMTRCNVRATGGVALHILGSPAAKAVSRCSYYDCDFESNLGGGALVLIDSTSTTQRFYGCSLRNFKGIGLKAVNAEGVLAEACTFESGDNSQPWVYAYQSPGGGLRSCWFEDRLGSGVNSNWFVFIDDMSHGWVVDGCEFTRGYSGATLPQAVQVGSTLSTAPKSVVVIAPLMKTTGGAPTGSNAILVTGASTEMHLIGGVECGPLNANAYPVQILDQSQLSTTTGGNSRVRVPRVSGNAGFVFPDVGQIYYDTAKGKFGIYGASGWRAITTEAL